ncbi:MAG: beta-glucosidase [Clostridiales bacterium]|nr:beta-glucosidase [Clostridiales bacterium]
MAFPKDFTWGVATASYQIEGAYAQDGRGLSIWDEFVHEGRSFARQTGDVAADFYHRYADDLALVSELGIPSFRFSVSWPRVLPGGMANHPNEKGLAFYDRLIDTMLKHNITPYLTLYHWDYPAELARRGGWTNPDSSDWYADYVATVARRLGDRVKNFITFNEPACFIGLGYNKGTHAPGQKRSNKELALMARNVMLAHGKGVQTLRALVPDAVVGYAPNCGANFPKTNSEADVDAARKSYFTLTEDNWLMSAAFWSDPVILGQYPKELESILGADMPPILADDFRTMRQPLDFYGQNIYSGGCVESDGMGGFRSVRMKEGFARTAIGWPVTPDSLYWAPKFFTERYGLPFVITENGMSCHDWVSVDGQVHDPNRQDLLCRYLRSLRRASEEGIDIRGYFVWTLLDDFEWDTGYNDRFGLIHVDFETQKRTIKDSARWYAEVIRTNGDCL